MQPRVTVAFGFGGVLLIITGTIFAFVGIQHRLIYVFLSTVYLVCLSISVLIIYVINPPVSDAVQGAYLVGIVVPGLIFGGGAMVFSNITEGLGCLLGGFCLSMWLLCLKPGGLLTSTTSIVIFICIFSAALWSMAYIKWTSTYSLIFSLAFSGATAIVLGIDCFSRAGLKELWVYIWRLNDNIFPLNTNTYPMTRGIKVEIAGIVMFTVLGILVQWKLWGFIKRKQRVRRVEREKERRGLEREEEMIGKRINWETAKQRERWDEVYEQEQLRMGADGQVRQLSLGSDSGIGDMSRKRANSASTLNAGKKSVPQITVHDEAIEMTHLPNSSRSSSGVGSLNDRISKVVYTSTGADEGVEMMNEPEVNARRSRDMDALAALEGERPGSKTSKRDPKSRRVSGSPDTPFPSFELAVGNNRRASRGNDRLSADSRESRLLHRLSHNSTTDKRRSISKKRLREDDDEWDRTSSIAATIDDLRSDIDFNDLRSLPSGTPRASMVLDKAVFASDPDPGLAGKAIDGNGDATDWTPGKQKPSAIDVIHMAGPSLSLTKDVLPPSAPRVASTYRTQEWMKRLQVAETPTVPELSPSVTPTKSNFPPSSTNPSSPGSQTISEDEVLFPVPTKSDEAPAPLNVSALQQTAVTGAVAPAPHRPRAAQAHTRRKSGDQSPYRASMQNTATNMPASRPVTGQGMNVGITRSSSYGSLATPKQQYRASSNPLQVLQEKDDDSMSLRERQSILRQSSMPVNGNAQASPSPSPYRMSSHQQQYPPELQHLNRRQSATRMQPSPAPMPNRTSTPGYGNPYSLEVMNRGVPRPQYTDLEIMEQRRLQMLEERRMAEVKRTEERQRAEVRDGAWVDRYRMSVKEGRGDEAHREGLRRMMSGAQA